jgi:hypothetical protein
MRFPLLLLGAWLPLTAAVAEPVDAYNVVWDSPSRDHHGSMPLGNGDVALNAWFTPAGELHFYLAKSDAWDDNARLVKVGKVRVRFEPNPVAPGHSYRQELRLSEGCLEITVCAPRAADAPVPRAPDFRLRLWVDARHPVVELEAESAAPTTATAGVELWRTNRHELAALEVSDVLHDPARPDRQRAPTWVEPDTVLPARPGRVGWFHHNVKSVGPQLLAEVQGLTGYRQPDPLLHRTFGAMITAPDGEPVDARTLRSPRGTRHRFRVCVLTRHPATPEQWQAEMETVLRRVEALDPAKRWAAHVAWWRAFWDRSWIRASLATGAVSATDETFVPANAHPVRLGMDQHGANRLAGELGRVSLFARPLRPEEVAALAARPPDQPPAPAPELLFTGTNLAPQVLRDSAAWRFAAGLTLEAWVRPQTLGAGGARLVDKITPGQQDGFLLDTHPGNSLRFICGETELTLADATPPGRWTHVAAVADPAAGGGRLYVNGRLVADAPRAPVRDEAAYVSQMYHLQRFITAAAGRGTYPIKFNGSLFTVPPGPTEADPDYRRWGPGYWWQNTRLPYISLNTSGDFDLQEPLFRLYVDQLLPLCRYRTRLYLGHAGAFYPECMMFWGAIFSETYGWTPFAQRADKLQESGWHKWEWVGGLELAWMALDYYDHTQDRRFLRDRALPVTREVLTFFEQHYPTNAQGQLVMHPSQALETWWHCTNAAPELAGCLALTERLLALPASQVPAADRALARRLRAKLPPLPLREVHGRLALAPAEFYADKRNIENPELYAVFPFRLFAFNRPHLEWALAALEHRWDRGHFGWRQDDIFMAYLGRTEEARRAIVSRARQHDRQERFPAFWGPNYDWTPDQDHGGVLMKTFQAMLLQTDGDQIFLFPAWPREWEVDFKLHAPRQTVLEGRYRGGRLERLRVTPATRRADVTVCAP